MSCDQLQTLAPAVAAVSDTAIRWALGANQDAEIPTSFELAEMLDAIDHELDRVKRSIRAVNEASGSVTPKPSGALDRAAAQYGTSFRYPGKDKDAERRAPQDRQRAALEAKKEKLRLRRAGLADALAAVRRREQFDERFRCRFLEGFVKAVASELTAKCEPGVEFRLVRSAHFGYPREAIAANVRVFMTEKPYGAADAVAAQYGTSFDYRGKAPKAAQWSEWKSVILVWIDWSASRISVKPPRKQEEHDLWWWIGEISSAFLTVVDIVTLQGIVRRGLVKGIRYVASRSLRAAAGGKAVFNRMKKRLLDELRAATMSIALKTAPESRIAARAATTAERARALTAPASPGVRRFHDAPNLLPANRSVSAASNRQPAPNLLPGNTRPPRVVPNATKLSHELRQMEDIAELRGGRVLGEPYEAHPAIDGAHFDPQSGKLTAITLKEVEGRITQVLYNAEEAEKQAAKYGYKNVELYIHAQKWTRATLEKFAKGGQGVLAAMPGRDSISMIYIRAKDGWLVISRSPGVVPKPGKDGWLVLRPR